jgi:hypothetical protein
VISDVEVEIGTVDFDDGKGVAGPRVLGAEASRHRRCAPELAAQGPEFVVTGGVVDPDGVAVLGSEHEEG